MGKDGKAVEGRPENRDSQHATSRLTAAASDRPRLPAAASPQPRHAAAAVGLVIIR
jgi:hypothetical protein